MELIVVPGVTPAPALPAGDQEKLPGPPVVKTYPAVVPVGNKAVKAAPADVAPVPPEEIAKGLVDSDKPVNVGVAVVLKSCGVLIVNVLLVPVTAIPLVVKIDITPPGVLGVADPIVPRNNCEEIFARA